MNPYFSLLQLKHQLISPLQESWQTSQVCKKYPQMQEIIEAFRKIYPYPGATTTISLQERETRGIDDDQLTYGETRWTTFLSLIPEMKLKPDSHFIDLGCGAGFLCLLISQGLQVQATGVDMIQGFIDNANQLVKQLELEQIRFQQANFFELEWLPFDCFYTTATCFPDETLDALSEKLIQARSGARILSVTSPIEGHHIRQIKQIRAKYDWGMDWVYVAERK